MTRAEHLAWCKERALEYADAGDKASCMASMASDLGKHDETRSSVEIVMVTALATGDSPADLRRWVEGFA